MKNQIEININPGNASFIENYLSDLYGSPQLKGRNLSIVKKYYSAGISLKSTRGFSTFPSKNRSETRNYINKIIIPKSTSKEIKTKLISLAECGLEEKLKSSAKSKTK
ncbi:hypothetical protein HYS72_03025 [Candidatus Pacearchaeota archaeon]|nr:hypothetical protein [Candidatus Pacearchaeota archaeon]MBI2057223.1 hypothetical protein [Candidatus Pacearchaeota archaeon]